MSTTKIALLKKHPPVVFEVYGRPAPQPRPRFVGKGRRPVSTASQAARLWRQAIAVQLGKALRARPRPDWLAPDAGGVRVEMTFRFHSADRTRWGRPHTQTPDADNLAKLVLDVMDEAGMLPGGDRRVADLVVSKVWTRDDSGVHVIVSPSFTDRGKRRDPTGWGSNPPPWLSEQAARKRWRRNGLALRKALEQPIEEAYPEVRDARTGKTVLPAGWGAPDEIVGVKVQRVQGVARRPLTPEEIEAQIRERMVKLRAAAGRRSAERRAALRAAAQPKPRRGRKPKRPDGEVDGGAL